MSRVSLVLLAVFALAAGSYALLESNNVQIDWCTSTSYCNDGYHCCSDNQHCCPNGYICDLARLKCIRSGANGKKNEIPAIFTKSNQNKVSIDWCTSTSYCNDGYHCCSDNQHCCPNGYVCDLAALKCIRSGANGKKDEVPAVFTKNNQNKVSIDWCTSTSYCNDGYHCCSDNQHCCPNGYICDLARLKCIRSGANGESMSIPAIFINKA